MRIDGSRVVKGRRRSSKAIDGEEKGVRVVGIGRGRKEETGLEKCI